MDECQTTPTINALLNAINTDPSETINRHLTELASLTQHIDFCSEFVELNGIDSLVWMKSRMTQEDINVCFIVQSFRQEYLIPLICDLTIHRSAIAKSLLLSTLPRDLVHLLRTSDVRTTELILKIFVNLGIDEAELFRSEVGTVLNEWICFFLRETLPTHLERSFDDKGAGYITFSSLDKLSELCLKILNILVKRNQRVSVTSEFVDFVVPLLHHISTTVVMLVLRLLCLTTSDDAVMRSIESSIPIVDVDGETCSIQVVGLLADLFDRHLNRIRTDCDQMQVLRSRMNVSDAMMTIDTAETDRSDNTNMVSLTSQVCANCGVLEYVSNLVGQIVCWEGRAHEMLGKSGVRSLIGECLSFFHKQLEFGYIQNEHLSTMQSSRISSETTIEAVSARLLQNCLFCVANMLEVEIDENQRILRYLFPREHNPGETLFSILSTLRTSGIPILVPQVVRIVKQMLKGPSDLLLTLAKSRLVEELFEEVTILDLIDEKIEINLMDIAIEMLLPGLAKDSRQNSEGMVAEREYALRLHSMLTQSHFFSKIEAQSHCRSDTWIKKLSTLRSVIRRMEC
ncbi:hypothetical protein BLNAU_15339 [Blattamonas nauphoetae]|uniref:Uncharacterized protein n=1 Tax=Blattamonas nauphoetae TaxID=2049346 RepID=A0ABQ9XHV9_9EUKA|nr:hypothetical protein BLNAU_15339 [Blattamonas nauphoetae]